VSRERLPQLIRQWIVEISADLDLTRQQTEWTRGRSLGQGH
jgi:hypothetical protein